MIERFVFAGFGGQGIMLMGKVLAYAAMKEDKYVTWMPSYGAEVRGGTAHSMVVISDNLVASPIVKDPTICVVMNSPSLKKFEGKVQKKGLLIINRSLIKESSKRNDIDILEVNATDIAEDMGNPRIANMVMLGAILGKRGILKLDSLLDALKDVISKKYSDMISLNEKALKKGYEHGKS
ncbi:MAG: 2-oxoacid:acceptor oxidoreductase family protein [Candidatus Omnitrophota bacterium]